MSEQAIERRDDVLGGAPVFRGTRVLVRTLLDYLEGGETIDQFLDDYPTVTRAQVIALLESAGESWGADASAA